MNVVFFGHRNTQSTVKPLLEQTVRQLIKENEEITFLVGTHGAFDLMVQSVLAQAMCNYPRITCYIVLSYIPVEAKDDPYNLPSLVPVGIESVPKRFAISFSNKYMVNVCDTIVCYVTHDWGGAAQFVEKGKRKGKAIINLANL